MEVLWNVGYCSMLYALGIEGFRSRQQLLENFAIENSWASLILWCGFALCTRGENAAN